MLLIIPSVTKGQPATIQLSKADLFALSSIVADSYFSDQSNVKSCVIEYNSNPSDQKKVLRFDLSQQTPSSAVFMSETARDEFWLEHVILEDFDGGTLVLTRNELPSGLDILFGSSGPQLVSLSISYDKPQIVYVEQTILVNSEEVPANSSFDSPIFVSVEKTPLNASASLLASPSSLEITEVSGGFEITSNTVTTGSLSVSSGSVVSNSLQMVKHQLKELLANSTISSGFALEIIGELNGIVYFSILDRTELWKTNGTVSGTTRLLQNKYISPIYLGNNTPAVLNDSLLLSIADDIFGTNGKLYKITNSSLIPEQISNINSAAGQNDGIGQSGCVIFNNEIYFRASLNGTNTVLYKTNGTLNGTMLVANTNPSGNSLVVELAATTNAVYFTARQSGTTRTKVFKTTGTQASVVQVSNTYPGNTDGAGFLTAVGSSIYFRANDNSTRLKVFRYSPELSAPVRVSNTRNGASDSPSALTKIGSKLFFTSLNSLGARKLYVTEGSEQSTSQVSASLNLSTPTILNNQISFDQYLLFTTGTLSDYKLFKTDGMTTELIFQDIDATYTWSSSNIKQKNNDLILAHPSGIYKLAPESATPTLISQPFAQVHKLVSVVGNNIFILNSDNPNSSLYKLSLLNENGQNNNEIKVSDLTAGAGSDWGVNSVFVASGTSLFIRNSSAPFPTISVLTNADL